MGSVVTKLLGRTVLWLVVAGTAGCSSAHEDELKACEELLLPTLKAPSTYKRVDQTIGLSDKSGKHDIFIQYDAVNSYNAPLRATFWCTINEDGIASPGGENVEEATDNIEALADEIARESSSSGMPPPTESKLDVPKKPTAVDTATYETPVCDRPDSEEKFALMNEIGTDCMGE